MIPLTTLYDEYIDRPTLTEQKTIWVYSSSPQKWGRKIENLSGDHILHQEQARPRFYSSSIEVNMMNKKLWSSLR